MRDGRGLKMIYGCGQPDQLRHTRSDGPNTTRESAGRRKEFQTHGTPALGQG
jgi:hypothetical protein